MNKIISLITNTLSWLSLPSLETFRISYLLEILILAILFYHIIKWVRDTRAWTLFRGILVVVIFAICAYVLNLTTILWLITNTINVIVISVIVLFQPELRRALEQLGRSQFFAFFFRSSAKTDVDQLETDRCNNEIIKAVFDMAAVKTGALIVIEQQVLLNEYERTGIELDARVSSQLLINIFEHNTPLHDGAVFIRNNRVIAATCYLPLSENDELSKALGTRHRAGVGISEISDSITIIVSEETGFVSVARDGQLRRHLNISELRGELQKSSQPQDRKTTLRRVKGVFKNEKKADE